MRRTKNKLVCASVLGLLIFIMYFLGAIDHISEETFSSDFSYPLNVNIHPLVDQVRYGIEPDIDPINYYDYEIFDVLDSKCPDGLKPRLVILVKSSMENFERRAMVRRTWGLERRFEDFAIRTIFLLGVRKEMDVQLQEKIDIERKDYHDILQSNFIDSYFNNTIKTMMGFRWLYEYCPFASFYLFADDDMFISVKNLLTFLEDPVNYPEPKIKYSRHARSAPKYLVFASDKNKPSSNSSRSTLRRTMNLKDVSMDKFFAGFVFTSSPLRHKSSKWHVSLTEYPWDKWPPYITAGAYVLSNEAAKNMYVASLFTKHFRFDDIYLGIIALKLGIVPFHCDEFYFYKKSYSPRNYKYLIASHGYHDPEELERVWTTQLTGARV